MSNRQWLQPGAKPGKGSVELGDFWANKPYTRKQTILKVGKNEYRVSSVQGMKPEECETILAMFLNGQFDHTPAVREKSLEQVGWNKPSRFSKRGENISIGFLHKSGSDGGFFDLQVKLEGNELTILQMFQAVP